MEIFPLRFPREPRRRRADAARRDQAAACRDERGEGFVRTPRFGFGRVEFSRGLGNLRFAPLGGGILVPPGPAGKGYAGRDLRDLPAKVLGSWDASRAGGQVLF